MSNRFLLAGSALLLLGGCAVSSAPAPEPPPSDAAISLSSPLAPEVVRQPILSSPLEQDAAVALALAHSPSLAALRAQAAADQATLQAQARPGLLNLSIERLTRGDEKELNRSLSIGLLDWLTWPWRAQQADAAIRANDIEQARAVLTHSQRVRAQWVRTVAAQQQALYQQDLLEAARAQTELARRLQQQGHFNALQAAEQAQWQSDAELAALDARRLARSEREALIRLMGLSASDAQPLTLPDRLPDLPSRPRGAEELAQAAREQGLDVQLAYARWQALASQRQRTRWTSWIDVEAGLQRNSTSGQATQRGGMLDIRLTQLDFGMAEREANSQAERAALARWHESVLNLASRLREQVGAEQDVWQQATHARDVLLPARQRLLTERLKHYNGMLTGPFELMAEARAQVGAVQQALSLQQAYWLTRIATDSVVQGADMGSLADGLAAPAQVGTNSNGSH